MRIVEQDDALAFENAPDRVQLDPDVEMPDGLLRLDEGAADVVIADQPHLHRQAGFLRESDRRADARVRDGHDDIGAGRLPRAPACGRARYGPRSRCGRRRSCRAARNRRARTRSARAAAGGNGLIERRPPSLITSTSPGSTSRTYVRANQVERTGLGADDPGVARADRAQAAGSRADRARRSAGSWSAARASRRRGPARWTRLSASSTDAAFDRA